MTEQEMIRHLHSAIEHAAPDAVGDVLPLRCAERNGGYDTTGTPGKNRRTRRMAPWLAAACLALIIAGEACSIRSPIWCGALFPWM